MTDAIYPQVRIVPERFLNPETVEKLLNLIAAIKGVRRILLKGQNLPPKVPYGPARGRPNPHPMKRTIHVCGQDVELQVHVGFIILELENRDPIPELRGACESVFTDFSYGLQEGRFMKSEATLSDFAKYGTEADKDIIGMTDPRSKCGPIILQGVK
jgi:methyl-coenzyme M reductase subunit D